MMRTVQRTGVDVSELYNRGAATLVASWAEYASASPGARLVRHAGVAVAAFPKDPERGVYNNALLDRCLSPAGRAGAIEAMESAYAAAGVGRYAAWAHEHDRAMIADLLARGYRFDTSSRAMGMSLDEIRAPRPTLALAPADLGEHLRIAEAPEDLLAGIDAEALHLVLARDNGETVSTAIAYDHGGDCGIFNLGTVPHARSRGMGTAVTLLQLHDARERGCTTASLQSTRMAEHLYASVGFRDLGRFLEYVPR